MKQSLTKRERVLIFIAAVVVMVFAAYSLGIGPLNKLYGEREQLLEALLLERSLIQMKLDDELRIRKALSDAEALAGELRGIYPRLMPNEDVDRMLTGLCISSGLSPISLNMEGPADLKISGAEERHGAAFAAVLATMNLTGGYDALKILVDEVGNTEYIRITQMSFSRPESVQTGREPAITVIFEVVMLKDGV